MFDWWEKLLSYKFCVRVGAEVEAGAVRQLFRQFPVVAAVVFIRATSPQHRWSGRVEARIPLHSEGG